MCARPWIEPLPSASPTRMPGRAGSRSAAGKTCTEGEAQSAAWAAGKAESRLCAGSASASTAAVTASRRPMARRSERRKARARAQAIALGLAADAAGRLRLGEQALVGDRRAAIGAQAVAAGLHAVERLEDGVELVRVALDGGELDRSLEIGHRLVARLDAAAGKARRVLDGRTVQRVRDLAAQQRRALGELGAQHLALDEGELEHGDS